MRKLMVTTNMSLDRVIDWPAAGFDPLAPVTQASLRSPPSTRRSGRLLLGRRTFEAFRTFRPNQTRDRTGLADYLNRVPNYVLASTLDEPQWEQPRSSAATPSRTSLA